VLTAVTLVAVLIAAFILWRHVMPDQWKSAQKLGELLRSRTDEPLGPAYVIGCYALLASAFVPITALITGVALVFDPAQAFAYALCGSLSSALLNYGAGRCASGPVLRRMRSPRLQRFREQLHAHTFSATVTARLLPVGNFSAINLLAGALAVPLWPFVLGNVAGMLFGITGITLLTDRMVDTFHRPTPRNVAFAALLLAGLIGASFALQRLVSRRKRPRNEPGT
jgi:uncharacterized membrane protein YdjX (TVP38/TMEM64 family)